MSAIDALVSLSKSPVLEVVPDIDPALPTAKTSAFQAMTRKRPRVGSQVLGSALNDTVLSRMHYYAVRHEAVSICVYYAVCDPYALISAVHKLEPGLCD